MPDTAILTPPSLATSSVPPQRLEPVIELRGITRTFLSGDAEMDVLRDVNLSIMPGEFVSIMGTSGSGKTTLMNIIGCLDRPSRGEYRFSGRDVSQFASDELAELRRSAFGFIFQSYNLIGALTAVENVEVPAIYAGDSRHQRRERAESLLGVLGLSERLDHRPSQLSGGQQQRVSIARALMNGGQIILADEPTGALDSKSGREVMALLKELSEKGHTVVLITHDPEVARYADRQVEIRDGEIIADSGSVPRSREPLAFESGKESPVLRNLAEAGRMSFRSLWSNLFRTSLTLLGIVIGVASVITMLAIGDGARSSVVDRISSMGSNLLLIRPGGPEQVGRGNITTLIPEDVDAINALGGIIAAIPELTGGMTMRAGALDHATQINATSADFPAVRDWAVSHGTFFSALDQEQYAAVAVLGDTVARELYGEEDPLGEYLMISNILFQVIGVMEPKGASPMGHDQDDMVYVPFTTGSLRLFGQRFLRNVTVAVADVGRVDEIQKEVHQLLLQRHGREDFRIRNMASLIDSVSEAYSTLTILLGSIAAISLLVGGIGVMNIMLVSVTERTREIGIRMATGANTSHILQQFLTEALVVSALGGLLGVVIGLGVTAVVASLGMPVTYALFPVVLAFSCAFATGLVFGFLPARKAARLDPVVALASE
ncbi:MacB family efflux pump subunit [Nitrincola sp. MINF-07-Sa-05]|uniref:MacB family efflux pump subunit n=1 Tax=Nitrincola salilacus TaxID=3400273 RepID=UPI003917BBE6